ncbi:apolipoprotein N-acyltransferase [Corynebacterium sp. 23_3061]|uniref:apolipoprotein N-acyltransferase n=1 Tax=Corynebacterium TaxID=1716 RepID=UPI001EF61624|nr:MULTISPECIES: apolipoprotein N-acyltransferase [Corynebacterium]MDN8623402.1 apolipoprotein N-acyltransferase [Corynebacterium kroppenstedtii]
MPTPRPRSTPRWDEAAHTPGLYNTTRRADYGKRFLYTVIRLSLAAFAGLCVYASYEPNGLWLAAPLGIALLITALQPWGNRSPAPSAWLGALIAFTQGLITYLFYLPWIGEYVGSLPWIALSIVEALYSLLFGAGTVFLLRAGRASRKREPRELSARSQRGSSDSARGDSASKKWSSSGGRLSGRGRSSRVHRTITANEFLFTVIGIPTWYLAVEYARSHWPFGGFAWTRLAWGQVSGPLLSLARIGGPALITVATVTMGVGITIIFRRVWIPGLVITLIIPIVAGLAWSQVDAGPNPSTERIDSFAASKNGVEARGSGTQSQSIKMVSKDSGITYYRASDSSSPENLVTVAVVQGNVPRLGLDFNDQQRAVLANHRDATLALARRIEEHKSPKPDFVVWPENSSDVDPFLDPLAQDEIQQAAEAVGVPILVGTLTHPGDQERNTIVVWDPETGPGERHDKVYLQPFGEYMPWRGFFRHFSSYVDMAGNFGPGDDNGVIHVRSGTTNALIPVGVGTCYEVAFDGAFQHAVEGGAQIFTVPTNNATFGFTDMSYQQLAMSRLRSVEYDRATVVAATSGVSAIIRPDGRVSERTQIFTEGILHAQLPLRATRTIASYSATFIEWALCGLGVVMVLGAAISQRKPQRVKSK